MALREESSAPSEAQMEIMNVVWDLGEPTVAEVWKALSAKRNWARNTVQTMIARLEEKGRLKRVEDGPTLRYRAVQGRATTLKELSKRMVATLFQGSTEGLLSALLAGKRLTNEEAVRLRALIDQSERKKLP